MFRVSFYNMVDTNFLTSHTVHIDQFKQMLTREVLAVSHEVGRLQTERQLLQRQVADLHAYHVGQQRGTMGFGIPARYGARQGQMHVSRSMSLQEYPHPTSFPR
jgi:hypothetical protein